MPDSPLMRVGDSGRVNVSLLNDGSCGGDLEESAEGGDGEDRVHDREVRMSSRLRWRIECEGSLGLSVRSSSCFYTLASKACRPLALRVCVESSGYWLLASEGQLLVSMQLCET